MGVTAGHSADDEANVQRQMSLRPLNTELSSGTGRLLVRELQRVATVCVCVSVSVDAGTLHIFRYIRGGSKKGEKSVLECVQGYGKDKNRETNKGQKRREGYRDGHYICLTALATN